MKRILALAALAILVVALSMPAARADSYCTWLTVRLGGQPIVNQYVCIPCPIGTACPDLWGFTRTPAR